MLKHSKKNTNELWELFEEKFDELASKLAIDQGISFSVVEQARREKMAAMAQKNASGLSQVSQPGVSNNVLDQVKLGIDFTKLAKLAQHSGKKELSNYLIVYEKQIVKKIPFYLQVQEYEKALKIAVEGGDPNNINKVFTEILKRELDSGEAVIEYASRVQDGLRHLRNYAKKRGVAGQLLLK